MDNKLHFMWVETLFGYSILGWHKEKLVFFLLPRKDRLTAFSDFCRKCQYLSLPLKEEKKDPFSLKELIQSYFQGEKVSFHHYPFFLEIYPSFTQKVLQVTALIPYGATHTYGELAQKLGTPSASRAVGNALGKNLLPLLIPCHRVIAQRSLGGFGEGLRFKVLLLSLEHSNLASNLH